MRIILPVTIALIIASLVAIALAGIYAHILTQLTAAFEGLL